MTLLKVVANLNFRNALASSSERDMAAVDEEQIYQIYQLSDLSQK